jgi:hypothetical protein
MQEWTGYVICIEKNRITFKFIMNNPLGKQRIARHHIKYCTQVDNTPATHLRGPGSNLALEPKLFNDFHPLLHANAVRVL